MLAIFRPDPDGVAIESLDFIRRVAREAVRIAGENEQRTAATIEMYAGGTWDEEQRIAQAEEALDVAQGVATHASIKLAWEERAAWRMSIQCPKGSMPKPWINDVKSWLKIFSRQPPPSSY